MSLKAFHILFIALATVLAAGCAWWAFDSSSSPAFGAASAVAAVALLIYGIYFVKKSRGLIL